MPKVKKDAAYMAPMAHDHGVAAQRDRYGSCAGVRAPVEFPTLRSIVDEVYLPTRPYSHEFFAVKNIYSKVQPVTGHSPVIEHSSYCGQLAGRSFWHKPQSPTAVTGVTGIRMLR
jgi:hypothetical protein